jgi:hypothetical protein
VKDSGYLSISPVSSRLFKPLGCVLLRCLPKACLPASLLPVVSQPSRVHYKNN